MDFGKKSALNKQLLVTLIDNGSPLLRARYALMRGGKVVAEGECAPMDLPYAPEARAVFFSRSGYFNRVEAEVRNARTLPFQARRLIEGAMAFNESFRARFASTEVSAGRYQLDLAAAGNDDIQAAVDSLPTTTLPFTRLVLTETAIAALVNLETKEPASVVWMRGGIIIGILVRQGVVLTRTIDRPATDQTLTGFKGELAARLDRVRSTVAAAARRLLPEREVSLALAFGELLGKEGATTPNDDHSRALEAKLARHFPGANTNAVLVWPELYGLSLVPACYSLLDSDYQKEAVVSRYATWAGVVLLACGVLATMVAFWVYYNSYYVQTLFASRNAKLDASYTAFQKQLPTPEQLAVLAQRLHKSSGEADFRVDSFLAWVSHLTPEAALIHRLGISTDGVATATTPAPTGNLPLVTIEWDVAGDYTSVEKLTADLLVALGTRTHLSDSKLEYKPGGNARFTTVLTPVAGAFKE